MLACKCVRKEIFENFKDHFKTQSHDRVTRNNNYLLQIPKKKLKYAKNGFFSMGVTLYNELPTKTRQIENVNAFGKDVNVNAFIYVNKVILYFSFSFIYQNLLAEGFLLIFSATSLSFLLNFFAFD